LLDIKNYLNESNNGSIKKYKSVIKEYHKKYCSEITVNPQSRQIPVKIMMKESLTKGKLLKDTLSSDEIIMIYWMIEFIGLDKNAKKDYLDGVIDPKNKELTRNYLQERIRSL